MKEYVLWSMAVRYIWTIVYGVCLYIQEKQTIIYKHIYVNMYIYNLTCRHSVTSCNELPQRSLSELHCCCGKLLSIVSWQLNCTCVQILQFFVTWICDLYIMHLLKHDHLMYYNQNFFKNICTYWGLSNLNHVSIQLQTYCDDQTGSNTR